MWQVDKFENLKMSERTIVAYCLENLQMPELTIVSVWVNTFENLHM